MYYDCEVMDCDCEDMNFMMGPSNLNVYEHRFINTSTIETTKRDPPHKGHNRKYMELKTLITLSDMFALKLTSQSLMLSSMYYFFKHVVRC